jgi:hypothetical protein
VTGYDHDALRRLVDYHEDLGPVVWWTFPVTEPPYVGTPSDLTWPGHHLWWAPIHPPSPPLVARRLRLSAFERDADDRPPAAGDRVMIWSDEHRAWWRPNRCGYVNVRAAGGVYTFADARTASWHCGAEKGIVYEVLEKG